MKIIIPIVIVLLVAVYIAVYGRKQRADLKAGGIYSVHSGDGDFAVVKVLVLDGDAVHIRLYKNNYPQRPDTVNTNELSLGSMQDGEGNFGIGHLPINKREFLSWKPVLFLKTTLVEEELEGYEIWKEAPGGVFGQ